MTLEELVTREELFINNTQPFKAGTLYELPFCISHGYPIERKPYFWCAGMVGNGNLFRFVAELGGWSVSLSPAQLIGRFSPANKKCNTIEK